LALFLTKMESQPAVAVKGVEAMADEKGPTQARILIVEDESIVALDICGRLAELGYDTPAVAHSAEKAIQKIADTQPDLVLMDIRLKGQMDGVEAAEQIRTQFDIPVVYLTAYADKATLERAKITQPFGYILKPFQERELHATVEMALYRHKMERKLKEYRDHLEGLVEARTDELRMANEDLQQEIAERERAEQALQSAHDELRRRVGERLHVTYQVGQELTLLHDEKEIFDRVLEVAARVLHFERASYGLVDETASELEYSYYLGDGMSQLTTSRLPLERDRGIAVDVVCTREAIRISDTTKDQRYISYTDGRPSRSQLCVPMKIGAQVMGVLNVESIQPDCFSSDDQQLLQALADRAAVALENARLYSQLRQRVAELTALYTISEAVTASLDLHETLTVITDHTTQLLGTAAASVALRDEGGQKLSFAAASGESSEFVLGKQLALPRGIVSWVAQHGEPALVPDVSADPRFFTDFDQASGFATRSILCVPLQYKGKTIGAVEAINKRSGPFDQEDLRLLTSLAAPAATAIENARLHAETEQRAKQLAFLHELDRAITASLRVSDVYHAAARHVSRLLSYDRLSITMIEGDELKVTYVADDDEGSPPAGIRLPLKTSSVGWAVVRGQPLLRHNIAADARFPGDEQLLASGIKSEMIIPLRVKGNVIGTWNIGSREKGAYSTDDLEIAQSMADQLAIAIENARLFEQVRAGSERLQTLSRQLVEVQETERRHIARELHDRAGQALTSLMVGLRLLEQKAEEPEKVVAQVTELKSVANEVLEDLHQLATELRPASLDHLGLVAALRQHAETFSRRHDLVVEFEAVGIQDERLSLAVETALYRIVQEALTNVIRHANASRVGVLLERRGDQVLAIVEDDGLGFNPEAALEGGRLGLLGMQERAQMVGGALEIESSAGAGTTLFVEVPYVDTHPDR
jgi:signal transduction histidine kinase